MQDAVSERQNVSAHGATGMSRRQFLLALSAIAAAASAVAGCQVSTPAQRPTPIPPPPPGNAIGGYNLEEFLRFSSVLTEFDHLDPAVGRLYLQSLVDVPAPNITLEEIYVQSGFRSTTPPQTLADLEQTGIFAHLPVLTLLNRLTEYWYTGIYDTTAGQAVATFTGALTWRALTFAHPISGCGGAPDYWSQPSVHA